MKINVKIDVIIILLVYFFSLTLRTLGAILIIPGRYCDCMESLQKRASKNSHDKVEYRESHAFCMIDS